MDAPGKFVGGADEAEALLRVLRGARRPAPGDSAKSGWQEGQHPRDEHGQFAEGGTGPGASNFGGGRPASSAAGAGKPPPGKPKGRRFPRDEELLAVRELLAKYPAPRWDRPAPPGAHARGHVAEALQDYGLSVPARQGADLAPPPPPDGAPEAHVLSRLGKAAGVLTDAVAALSALHGPHAEEVAAAHPKGAGWLARAREAAAARRDQAAAAAGHLAARLASLPPPPPAALSAKGAGRAVVVTAADLARLPEGGRAAAEALLSRLPRADALATGAARVYVPGPGSARVLAALDALGAPPGSLRDNAQEVWGHSKAPVQVALADVPAEARGDSGLHPEERDVRDAVQYKRLSRELYLRKEAGSTGAVRVVPRAKVPQLSGVPRHLLGGDTARSWRAAKCASALAELRGLAAKCRADRRAEMGLTRKGWRPGTAKAGKDDANGQWVTLSPSGTHVFIDGGKISKGPAHMVGKAPHELSPPHRVSAEHGPNHPETGTPEGPKGGGNSAGKPGAKPDNGGMGEAGDGRGGGRRHALRVAHAARRALERVSGGDTYGWCDSVARGIALAVPGAEVWSGMYRGQPHVVAKVGDHFIDVSADQFGAKPVQVGTKLPRNYELFEREEGGGAADPERAAQAARIAARMGRMLGTGAGGMARAVAAATQTAEPYSISPVGFAPKHIPQADFHFFPGRFVSNRPHQRQHVGRPAPLILPEDRLDAKFDVRRMNHAQVVADQFRQSFVDHRVRVAAAHVVPELPLDRREGRFHV